VIALLVVLPLAAGVGALVARRLGRHIALLTVLACVAVAVYTALQTLRAGPLVHRLGGWGSPLGIDLRMDGLAAVMLLMSTAVGVATIVYARGYYPPTGDERAAGGGFWPLCLLLIGALNALFLSGDLFNLYVSLELVSISAVALVILSDDETALPAAMRYLLAAFVASMLYLAAVGLLYAAYGSLDLVALGERITREPAALVAVALISAALLVKTALFPVHFWLPRAHAAAPAPVSALLSSLVITASYYLFIRLWSGPFTTLVTPVAGQLIGWLSTGAIVWGSIQALRQQHLKVMIAYSTVAQIGYLFLLIPFITALPEPSAGAEIWRLQAWNGGVYHAMSHALAKAAMFLAAGSIVHALGSDRIVGISGIARQLPITTYAFGIAGMTLIGLPPSGGFVAKWLLLSAAIGSGQWWWALVILIGGILTAGYIFLVLGQELSLAESDHEVQLAPVPRSMEYAAMALALVALILGVRVTEPLLLLRVGFPFAGG
jgi:multicomponent Na+:H+ antiporter subunit D